MTTPLVSVIIPTYNRARLLPRAIRSVMAQTFEDWEIVLVDDGSTDDSDEVIAGFAAQLQRRLIHIRQPNRGSSRARNRGIDACRGRFVTFLDSDDEFLPTKLERQLNLFAVCGELGFVYSDYAYVDLAGVRHESMFSSIPSPARSVPLRRVAPGLYVCRGDPTSGDGLFDRLIRGYFLATIVGMVRREVLGHAIRFPDDCAYAEEWLFYLKVARACRAGYVDEPLCLHHYTPASLARTDNHRNTVRYAHLLRTIRHTFRDLTRPQRRAVYRNLGVTYRQLGYDAHRAGNIACSLCFFARSFWYDPRPSLQTLPSRIAARLKPTRLAGFETNARHHEKTSLHELDCS